MNIDNYNSTVKDLKGFSRQILVPNRPADSNANGHAPVQDSLPPEGIGLGASQQEAPASVPKDFPLDALGGDLQAGAEALHEHTQAPISLCAQTALAVETFAVQHIANVRHPRTGASLPLSEDCISLGASGERKSSCEKLAIQPIVEREQELEREWLIEKANYDTKLEVYESEKKRILKSKKSKEDKQAELQKLNMDKPKLPRMTVYKIDDFTYEGLIRYFTLGQASLFICVPEGGLITGGHAMNFENLLKTAAGLTKFWDGDDVKHIRASKDTIILRNRRVTFHLMLQVEVGLQFIRNSTLSDQGFLSRCLIIYPVSTIGKRLHKEVSEEGKAKLKRYHDHLARLIKIKTSTATDESSGLILPDLELSYEARDEWDAFHDEVEKEMGEEGKYRYIRNLINKHPEHALRIAGVLTLSQDPTSREISKETMLRAIEIVKFYLHEMLRISELGAIDPAMADAQDLSKWLVNKWTEDCISISDIGHDGPRPLRSKALAMRAIKVLIEEGLLMQVPDGAMIKGKLRREAWLIRRDRFPQDLKNCRQTIAKLSPAESGLNIGVSPLSPLSPGSRCEN